MIIDLKAPVKQVDVAMVVGVTQQAISAMVKEGKLPAEGTLGEVLLAYCERLRLQAAGRMGDEHGGLDLVQERAALAREQREGEANPVFDPKDTTININKSVWVPDVAAWTALAADFHPRVRISAGLRAEAFGRIGEFALSPRGEVPPLSEVRMTVWRGLVRTICSAATFVSAYTLTGLTESVSV